MLWDMLDRNLLVRNLAKALVLLPFLAIWHLIGSFIALFAMLVLLLENDSVHVVLYEVLSATVLVSTWCLRAAFCHI